MRFLRGAPPAAFFWQRHDHLALGRGFAVGPAAEAMRDGTPRPKLHDAPTVTPRARAWAFSPASVVMKDPKTSTDRVSDICTPPPTSRMSMRPIRSWCSG